MFHCIGVTLRASLAPLAAPPLPGPPPLLTPRLRYPMVVWEGETQKGGFGRGTLVTRGRPVRSLLTTASPPLLVEVRHPASARTLEVALTLWNRRLSAQSGFFLLAPEWVGTRAHLRDAHQIRFPMPTCSLIHCAASLTRYRPATPAGRRQNVIHSVDYMLAQDLISSILSSRRPSRSASFSHPSFRSVANTEIRTEYR